jgi:hypothetical protein
MLKQHLLRAPLVALCGLIATLAMASAAQAAEPVVVEVDGNPACAEGTFVTKFDSPVPMGTTTKDGVTITRSGDYFDWSSTVAIDSVIAKGGPNANVYTYPYDAFGDEGLHAPLNGDSPYGLSHVEFCSDGEDEPEPDPGITLDKTGAATAAAGSTFEYSFTAKNTGNVPLTNVQLTDPKCQDTLTRVPDEDDMSFDPGDEWHFTCTVVAPAGPAQVDNVAEVCGDYDAGEETVCDDDPHTFTVPPPDDPPGENPPTSKPPVTKPTVTPNTVPPTVTPDGGVLPETIVSGRAQLRGPSGCLKQAFKARVSGRSIASVTFFVDGRKVKKIGAGKAFALKLNPKKYGLGRHKIVAKVRFTAESGTKARKLSLTFRRCAQGAVAPRFTG